MYLDTLLTAFEVGSGKGFGVSAACDFCIQQIGVSGLARKAGLPKDRAWRTKCL